MFPTYNNYTLNELLSERNCRSITSSLRDKDNENINGNFDSQYLMSFCSHVLARARLASNPASPEETLSLEHVNRVSLFFGDFGKWRPDDSSFADSLRHHYTSSKGKQARAANAGQFSNAPGTPRDETLVRVTPASPAHRLGS